MEPKETAEILDYLQKKYSYDPVSGNISNKHSGRIVSGVKQRNGHLRMHVLGRQHQLHRVAFALSSGRWPHDQIDHANLDKTDNRLENLRECNGSQQQWNSPAYKRRGEALPKGVYRVGNKYKASVTVSGFSTPDEAKAARDAAAKILHGEFFRE